MPFPLAGALTALIPKAVSFIGGLFNKPSTVAPAAGALVRSITPIAQRALVPAGRTITRALPALRKGAGIVGAGGAFELGQRIVGGRRGLSVSIGRDGQAVQRFYRRMNPLNPRALRRAMRRVKGFEKFARRVGYTKRRPMGRGAPARSWSRPRRGDYVDDEVLGE